jgi:nucleotide-binding universal stress UspA family protein
MYKRILVAIDRSPVTRALDEAIMLAKVGQARLLLLHVDMPEPLAVWGEENWMVGGLSAVDLAPLELDEHLFDAALKKAADAGVETESRRVEGGSHKLGAVIATEAAAWEADLIVASTHGRVGVDRMLLGSVADDILHNATMPVLLVHNNQP